MWYVVKDKENNILGASKDKQIIEQFTDELLGKYEVSTTHDDMSKYELDEQYFA